MTCVHGLDSRFCSICNRPSPFAALAPRGQRVTLVRILEFLNHEQIRATDGAVADALGVPARSMGTALGARRPEASWIVAADSGLPAGYDQTEMHPALFTRQDVIRSANELLLRMSASKA